MPSALTLTFMVIFCVESLAAMLQNGFIVMVLGKEWVRCPALPTGDMIVTCLAASRFCLHGIGILNNFLFSFDFCYQANYFSLLWNFINTLTFWLTAWLAIFYCVKIASFSHPVYLWLKWRVSRSVLWLMLGSLITCALSVISLGTGQAIADPKMITHHGNCTSAHTVLTSYRYHFFFHIAFLWFVPFFLFMVSNILLMFSLFRHVGQMKDRRPGPRDPSTQAHTMVLKSLTFFLIFYTAYFLSLIIKTMSSTTAYNHWHWITETIIYAGIFLHSTILVLSSPKLRKGLKRRL